jgi:hypothetical protein
MSGDPAARIWTAWMPQELREAATRDEPERFAKAVALVVAAVQQAKAAGADPDRLSPTLVWIDLIKRWAALRRCASCRCLLPGQEARPAPRAPAAAPGRRRRCPAAAG